MIPLGQLYRRFLRYPLWRSAHPLAPYEHYYASVIRRRLTRGRGHNAIGETSRPVRAGSELLDIAMAYGLQPSHALIDFGCGSLRLGKAVIDYLQPKRFIGMDVDPEFLALGRKFLGDTLLREKEPMLLFINNETLAEVAALSPDFIAAWHVCSKIPDGQLKRFFANIIYMMASRSQAFIQFPHTDKRRRLNPLNWTMSRQDFRFLVNQINPALLVEFIELVPQNAAGVTEMCGRIYMAEPQSI